MDPFGELCSIIWDEKAAMWVVMKMYEFYEPYKPSEEQRARDAWIPSGDATPAYRGY
jgi:hypothetical protein